MNKSLFITLFFSFFYLNCNPPEAIVEPSHSTRVPVAVNLQATKDTTDTGKARISLTWTVSDMTNIRTFEVQRAVSVFDKTGKVTKYNPMQPPVTTTSIVDSFTITSDTTYAYYSVVPTGKDRFIGKASDTLQVIFTK
ncbi:MAG: hypothetical protein HUU54_00750 [Ignavibacteriaceae bacterium]|nr:hypothetical protein [Ignavibacteriaceae bacterium]